MTAEMMVTRGIITRRGSSGHGSRSSGGFSRGARRAVRLLPSLGATLLALLGLAGCDSRPTGSGSYIVTIEWEQGVAPAGAALVFLAAPGLGAVTPLDGVLAWDHTPPGEEGGRRVVVIHPEDAPSLRFSVAIADRGVGRPQATILSLATQQNLPVAPEGGFAGYRVRVIEVN